MKALLNAHLSGRLSERSLAATGRLAELIGAAMAANPHGLADREIWLIDRT